MLALDIDFKSFFHKGLPYVPDDFLVALINGRQGSGKSYFAIYNLERKFKGSKVYTNIQSYNSTELEVVHFKNLEEVYNNNEMDCVFVIDELSKRYTKNSPIDKPFYSWLQQSRKHRRYVYLITQEYLQVPNWLRGVADLAYTTYKLKFLPLYATSLGYPVLDNDSYEWGLQEIKLNIYKRNKYIAQKYDTFEAINIL